MTMVSIVEMDMARDKNDKNWADFIRSMELDINEIFRLAPNEEDVQREFERLANETYKYFETNNKTLYPYVKLRSWTSTVLALNKDLPTELAQKLSGWEQTFQSFLERNLKVQLYYMLKDMSETENFSSWFTDSTMESRILDWVDSNSYEPIPLNNDCKKIITIDFYERLKFLRRKCGGWLFPTHVTNQILFVADKDLEAIRWQRSGTDYK